MRFAQPAKTKDYHAKLKKFVVLIIVVQKKQMGQKKFAKMHHV